MRSSRLRTLLLLIRFSFIQFLGYLPFTYSLRDRVSYFFILKFPVILHALPALAVLIGLSGAFAVESRAGFDWAYHVGFNDDRI